MIPCFFVFRTCVWRQELQQRSKELRGATLLSTAISAAARMSMPGVVGTAAKAMNAILVC